MSKKEAFERATMLMLRRCNDEFGGKRFYGYLIAGARKHFDHKDVETAGVNITDQINLYVNLDYFNNMESDKHRVELLEHEMKHLVNFHQKRLKDLDKSDFKLWNIACDTAINEPLMSLHDFGITVDKLNKELKLNLDHNQSAEYYFKKLKEYREENGGKGGEGEKSIDGAGDLVDDHSPWDKNEELDGENQANASGQVDEINQQIVKKAMKEAIEKCDGRGNVPSEVLKIYDKLGAATVNWRQQLKQFFARADKFNKVKTRKKRNRRYGYLNPARKKEPVTHIAIGIDESGSVSDAYHKQFFNEIKSIFESSSIKLTLIHADCGVALVEEYNPKNEVKRVASGGTAYMPAINEAKNLKVDGMIYFGDGDIFGEQLTEPKFPFLWAMEEGRDKPATWGRICHVKCKEKY